MTQRARDLTPSREARVSGCAAGVACVTRKSRNIAATVPVPTGLNFTAIGLIGVLPRLTGENTVLRPGGRNSHEPVQPALQPMFK